MDWKADGDQGGVEVRTLLTYTYFKRSRIISDLLF